MKIETIDKVNELRDSWRKLENLRKIIYSFDCRIYKKKIGFDNCGNGRDWECSKRVIIDSLDKTTVEELKAAIVDVIDKRQAEIEKEIEEM